MSQLRTAVIKLAHEKPHLRPHLLPILATSGSDRQANMGLLRPGVSVELLPKKTKLSPEGYPAGRATILRKVPAGMGLGGFYLQLEGRRSEVFVPFEDAKAVFNMRSIVLSSQKQALQREAVDRSWFLPTQVRGSKPLQPQGTNLEIYTWEVEGKPFAVAFAGKANKPIWNYTFSNEAQRAKRIQETIEANRSALAYKQQQQQERKDFQHNLKIGDILNSSWGYDQTNVEFYEVVQVAGKQVLIREVAQKIVRQSADMNWVVPVPGKFVGAPQKVIPRKALSNSVGVKIDSSINAYLWNGKPVEQTAAGWGH